MPFGKWKAVIEELRAQRQESERAWAERRAESERAWALNRSEQQARHQAIREFLDRNEAEWRAARREHLLARREATRQAELSRRAYEEGMALCAKLVERSVRAFDEFAAEIRDHREETRAQTQALLRMIDRMDRLDGGAAA
jgi:hypothetical protein